MKTELPVSVVLLVFLLVVPIGHAAAQRSDPCGEFRVGYRGGTAEADVLSSTWTTGNDILAILEAVGLTSFGIGRNIDVYRQVGINITCAGRGTDGRWHVYIDPEWLDSFQTWARYVVLAHEVAHILLEHQFTQEPLTSGAELELEADHFAGSALFHLGASMQDVLTVSSVFESLGDDMYPGSRQRLAALEGGWLKAERRARATLAVAQQSASRFPSPPPGDLSPEALAEASYLPLADSIESEMVRYYSATGGLEGRGSGRIFKLAIPDDVQFISLYALWQTGSGPLASLVPTVFHFPLADCQNTGWFPAPELSFPVAHYVTDRRRELLYIAVVNTFQNPGRYKLDVFTNSSPPNGPIRNTGLELHDCRR